MPISIFCLFFAFASTTVIAGIHQKLRTPSWLIGALAPVFLAAFLLAAKAMPFYGVVTEVPLVLLAIVSASAPVALMTRANLAIQAEKAARGAEKRVEFRTGGTGVLRSLKGTGLAAMVLFFPVMAGTMMTLCTRINYACWLKWECDGRIVEVTSDHANHMAPMLFVEWEGKTDHFSQVDPDVWSQAKVGMRLKKDAGSPMAWLDGKKVRMVPMQMKWWNDPK